MISEQYPSWLVEGLNRSAGIGFRENPNETIGQTSFTYNNLRGRIRTKLEVADVELSNREMGSAVYWLVNRIANMIGDDDKNISVEGYIERYVGQYLRDKGLAHSTGDPLERGPIHSKKWWETYYTPEKLEQTLTDREERREKRGEQFIPQGEVRLAQQSEKLVYVGIDGDDIGSLVEETLLTDDPEKAREISLSIHRAHERVGKLMKDVGGRLIFDGGDNMLIHMAFDPETIEEFRKIYKEETSHSATVGVGVRPVEAHYALVVGKNTGKDKVVVYDENVAQQLEEIKQHQQELEPLQKQLKYRAGAEGQSDIDAGEKIKGAMWELQMDVTEEAVYDILYRLIERLGLDQIEGIENFFNQDREVIKENIRQVYARRNNWNVRIAGREMTKVEQNQMIENMVSLIGAASSVREKIEVIIGIIGRKDAPLVQAVAGLDQEGDRLVAAGLQMAEEIDNGSPMESTYIHELGDKAGEAMSMLIPIEQELSILVRAMDNAQVEHHEETDVPIDSRAIIERITALTEIVGHSAMLVEMAAITSKSDPKIVFKANSTIMRENHKPGHEQLPKGKEQKSPHKRLDWLTTDEYNKDQIDPSKTDVYYVGGNLTKDMEQFTWGGDPGPAIYTP